MRILAIGRAERFSPNSVEKDRAILRAVADRLTARGHEVLTLGEEQLPGDDCRPQLVLTMARLPQTLAWLRTLGVPVVNRPEGVEHCARTAVEAAMAQIDTPRPPQDGPDGYWLKRGDAAAQERGDVVYAATRDELHERIAELRQRGVGSYTVSAHVPGDVVKFYGVEGTGFFRTYYPTDDGDTKFGDEQQNGAARHYAYSRADLQREAGRLACHLGVQVYGGDCIVRADGTFCIIDFNDWPSFSRCRDEAADAIASLVLDKKIEK